jgi:hypothetical protein
VFVDTYQSTEDLSDLEDYKIGGRMAHHMLYTALQEHPCYDGYLWAPFDTLLNVPRLQLFDQNKFWYHSPFGRYIPNPALDRSAARYPSYHAPPANISPDPANMTTPWKGWSEDWWYVTPTLLTASRISDNNQKNKTGGGTLAFLLLSTPDSFLNSKFLL